MKVATLDSGVVARTELPGPTTTMAMGERDGLDCQLQTGSIIMKIDVTDIILVSS